MPPEVAKELPAHWPFGIPTPLVDEDNDNTEADAHKVNGDDGTNATDRRSSRFARDDDIAQQAVDALAEAGNLNRRQSMRLGAGGSGEAVGTPRAGSLHGIPSRRSFGGWFSSQGVQGAQHCAQSVWSSRDRDSGVREEKVDSDALEEGGLRKLQAGDDRAGSRGSGGTSGWRISGLFGPSLPTNLTQRGASVRDVLDVA